MLVLVLATLGGWESCLLPPLLQYRLQKVMQQEQQQRTRATPQEIPPEGAEAVRAVAVLPNLWRDLNRLVAPVIAAATATMVGSLVFERVRAVTRNSSRHPGVLQQHHVANPQNNPPFPPPH